MKILHLIQKPQNRGAEMFTCQLSNHLVELGYQVKIIALFEGEAILPFNGEITSIKASANNRFYDVPAWKELASIVKEFNPDIIQANAGDTLKYAVYSKKLFGWKNPIVSRNASEVGRYLKSPIQKSFNSLFYKNVEFVISVSQASEKDFLNHFPFLSGRTKVIPVGLDTISTIKEISLKPDGVEHIVHVGGFSFEKNHLGLLRIFQSVLKSKPNVHLHLIGDGPLKVEIEEEVEKLGIQQNIYFYGFVNNPLSYIKAADVLVLPSIIEGLPGVLLEAMLCKTHVVAYNVGGISEIVSSQTGNLVEKDDEAGFLKAVFETLENPNVEQIDAAHKMVLKDFMNKEIALRFVEVYARVIGNSLIRD
ncbi:glycosyltransferase involved in cell wall biosynthesis [Gillisia mitskevichiae]|uniref:Glycosyltransferase involved in cell wall biosynthesis n=1 Tax=Gillisia mitskevichiae TaxID=270921 RepID=A0A495PIL3_9FLAO|nr:glycosyltransferase [Gillisia mitskevichiae]RKS50584.1 glycosyltransferase involved in cell wall biosynthesis [Gillisia mitskevichiae]